MTWSTIEPRIEKSYSGTSGMFYRIGSHNKVNLPRKLTEVVELLILQVVLLQHVGITLNRNKEGTIVLVA